MSPQKNVDIKNIKKATNINLNIDSKIKLFKISEIHITIKNILTNSNYPDIINFKNEYKLNSNNHQLFIENELNHLKELIIPYIDNPQAISKIFIDIKHNFLLSPNPKLLSIINSICEISPSHFYNQINIVISLYQSVFTEKNFKNFSEISVYFGDLIKIFLNKQNTYNKLNYTKFKLFCFNNMQSKNKYNQICGTLCLTSFIENCEYNYIDKENLNSIFEILIKLLNNANFNGKLELLNCFTSLIYCSGKHFSPYVKITLNNIINYCSRNESLLRKFSLNIIYALIYYFEIEINPMKDLIINELYFLKNDNNKETRELYSQILHIIKNNNPFHVTKQIQEEENENSQEDEKDNIRKKTEPCSKKKIIKKIKKNEKVGSKNKKLKNYNSINQLKSSQSESKFIFQKNKRIISLQNINPFNISLKRSNSGYYNNSNRSDNSLSVRKNISSSPSRINKIRNFKSSFQRETNNNIIFDKSKKLSKNKKLYTNQDNNCPKKPPKRLIKLTKVNYIPNNRYKKIIPTTGNNHSKIFNRIKLLNNNNSSKNNVNKNVAPSSNDNNNSRNSEIYSSHTRVSSSINNISTIPSCKIIKNSSTIKKNIVPKNINNLTQNTSIKKNNIDENSQNISSQEKTNFNTLNRIIKKNHKIKLPTHNNSQLSNTISINQNNFLRINNSLSNVYNPAHFKINRKKKNNNNYSENDQSKSKEGIFEKKHVLTSRLSSNKIKKKIKHDLIKNLVNMPINDVNYQNHFDVYKEKTNKIINDLKLQVSKLQNKLDNYETNAKTKEILNSLMEIGNFNDAFKFAIEMNDINLVYYVIKKFQFIYDKNNDGKEVIKTDIFAGVVNILCRDILSCDNLSLVLLFIKKIIDTKISLNSDTKTILKTVLNQLYEKSKELCLSAIDIDNILYIINILNKK